MEFEFRKVLFSDQSTAKLSMGHEAFATWLEQEAQNKDSVTDILRSVETLLARGITEKNYQGEEFTLHLNQSEAVVINHSIHDREEFSGEESLSYYDDEIQSSCGLDDFQHLMLSWSDFITN